MEKLNSELQGSTVNSQVYFSLPLAACPLLLAPCCFLLAVSCQLLFLPAVSFAQDKTVDVEIIESQIGLDDMAVTIPNGAVSENSRKAGSRMPLATGAPEGTSSDELSIDQFITINQTIKNAIEKQAELVNDNSDMDRELRSMRGQRTLENNRMNAVMTERDAYRQENERIVTMNREYQRQVSGLKEELEKKKAEVDEIVQRELQAAIEDIKSRPIDFGEASTSDLALKMNALIQERDQLKTDKQKLEDLNKKFEEEIAQLKSPPAPGSRKIREGDLASSTGTPQAATSDEPGTESGSPMIAALQNDKRELQKQIAFLEARLGQKDKEYARYAKMAGERAEEGSKIEGQGSSSKGQGFQKAPDSDSLAAGPLPLALSTESITPVLATQNKSLDVIVMLDDMEKNKQAVKNDEARIHYNMGNIYFNLGKYSRAAGEYRAAIELTPMDANAHFNLAFVSGEYLHDQEAAMEHYRRYLFLNPEAPDAGLVQEKILAAELHLRTRINSRLEEDWQKHKRMEASVERN